MPSDSDKLTLSADSGVYLHPRMPKLGSIQLSGQSGCRYNFRVYVWGHYLKPVSAVYVVTERRLEPDGTVQYLPIHVGETTDLSRIFENHPCMECFQIRLANTIAVFAEKDLESRKAIALDLLSAIKPPCNQLVNVGAAEQSEVAPF